MTAFVTLTPIRDATSPGGPSRRAPGPHNVASVWPGARTPSPRSVAAPSVGTLVPGAVSSPEPTLPDTYALLAMADACRRAADPALVLSSEIAACLAACPDAGPGFLRAAADLGDYASRLEQAAKHLRDQARDDQLQTLIAHLAAGGSVVCLPASVVVGQDENGAAAANDAAGPHLFGRLRRLLSGRR